MASWITTTMFQIAGLLFFNFVSKSIKNLNTSHFPPQLYLLLIESEGPQNLNHTTPRRVV